MPHTTDNIITFATKEDPIELAEQADRRTLAALIDKYAPHDGAFELPFPGLYVVKATKPNDIAKCTVCKTGLSIVPQGAIRVTLGKDLYEHDQSRMVAYSSEVPITVSIIKASKEEPYLGLVFHFDLQRLNELTLKAFQHGLPKNPDMQPIYIGKSHPQIIKSAIRLMEIMLQQEDIDLLIPLITDEILIRLLRSPIGASIAQIGMTDSNAHKISKAISWLKLNYKESMKIEDLAAHTGMSPSSFYQYFKSITSMSPLQYQKALRLQEARHLMISQRMDVSHAGLEVGYSTTSQFSREYSRFFGTSPSKDIEKHFSYKSVTTV